VDLYVCVNDGDDADEGGNPCTSYFDVYIYLLLMCIYTNCTHIILMYFVST